ncbi:MAG TPA: LysR family transcriptional regulator [Holophagaceae bacterium]|nr:LysR family transcriptional regulator [Holophagaceae bacterium]
MDPRDLALLPTLDALLQAGSVSGAAERLGLSTPAVSHALARLRQELGDEVLVRAGRGMVLTPRALAMRDRLHGLLEEMATVLAEGAAFDPRTLGRTFTLFTTDHALMVLGEALDRRVRAEAPGVCLRFLPSVVDDYEPLRQGAADLSICLLGHYPPEIRTRRLFTDRFVVVGRRDHPALQSPLTLDTYLGLEHGAVAPLGRTSHVDLALQEQGRLRRITRVVPFFAAALDLALASDLVFTVSDRAVAAHPWRGRLQVVEPPLDLQAYALHLVWHPRSDQDAAHRWLRELLLEVAAEAAPEAHEGATGDLGIRPLGRRRKG